MQLIIVTGMSGGGKSIAIRQLEDCGYYCISNISCYLIHSHNKKISQWMCSYRTFLFKPILEYILYYWLYIT